MTSYEPASPSERGGQEGRGASTTVVVPKYPKVKSTRYIEQGTWGGQTSNLHACSLCGAVVAYGSIPLHTLWHQGATDASVTVMDEPWCPDHGYGCEPSNCPCGHTLRCDCRGIADEH